MGNTDVEAQKVESSGGMGPWLLLGLLVSGAFASAGVLCAVVNALRRQKRQTGGEHKGVRVARLRAADEDGEDEVGGQAPTAESPAPEQPEHQSPQLHLQEEQQVDVEVEKNADVESTPADENVLASSS